jgi:hypothetical protein
MHKWTEEEGSEKGEYSEKDRYMHTKRVGVKMLYTSV